MEGWDESGQGSFQGVVQVFPWTDWWKCREVKLW